MAPGRSLKAVLPDLGGLPEPATFSASMRGYIALSRALDADGVLIARPFAPTLFQQGPQPFATLLLATLQGKIPQANLPREWAAAQELVTTASKRQRLVDTMWQCGPCGQTKAAKEFMSRGCTADDWCEDFLARVLARGPFRRYSVCSPDKRSLRQCSTCKKLRPKEAYGCDRAWKDAAANLGKCQACTSLKKSSVCSNCGTCDAARFFR